MSREHEDPPRPKSWPQDQVPSGDLDNRPADKWYEGWEPLQPKQIDPQQAIPDPLHSLGQEFIGIVPPAIFDGDGNQYMPRADGENENNH